jgi:TolB-like protein/DNA-binding winged helix-turn-helix (wHTH) protein/Tfp pilus assembly protein PilF
LLVRLLLGGSWSIISATHPGISGGFTAQEFYFGDFALDRSRYRLQRGARFVRLEKLPMELLILLVQRRGKLVSREEITERLWGKEVFLDIDHSINTAVRKVRLALRDDPEKPRFVETVVGKGYRFAAPVICSNGDSNSQTESLRSPAQLPSGPAVPSTKKRVVPVPLRVLLAGIAVLAVFTGALVLYRGSGAKSTKQLAIKSLAVLPLKNLSGDPTQEYLADGMTEALIGRLSGIHDLRVISRTSVMHFKDTQLSLPEISRMLRVDAIVEGSVIREGGRVRVYAHLIRGATDQHFWSEAYDRELGDALTLESEVAQSIARRVQVTVTGEERARLVAARHVSPKVYESYLKGRFAKGNSRAEVEKSITYFEEAIRKDPTFAPAYVGLAHAYASLGTVFRGAPPSEVRPKAISAARKALELDPELGEAHVLLAGVYQRQWWWADAESEYKQALELNPNDAAAHLGLADWLLCQGRTEEALAWSQRARELDPLGVTGLSNGWILFHARRYDEAIHELRSVLAVQPDYAMAQWQLGVVLIANRQPEEAIPVLEKVVSVSNRSPGVIGVLVSAYAHAGRRKEALRLVNELKRRRQKGYVPAAAFLNAYLGLGDYDEAFAWFERAYQEQSNILQFLKIFPIFDPVRNDPRFADLLHRVGLDKSY